MNRRWEDGIPALLAVALFILAELLRLFKGLSQYWGNIEIIVNALMLGIAIFFSAQERFSRQERSSSSRRVVWIISISLIALPMNVDVFGHAIRLEHLLADLWGWHSFWIACAVFQLLVLTPLGKEILAQFKLLLAQFTGFLKWGANLVASLGRILSHILDQILALIMSSSRRMVFITIFGFFLWACWLGTQIPGQNIRVLLADIGFLGKNLLVWLFYLLAALLVCLIPLVVRKAKEGLLNLDAKHLLAVIAIASVLAVSVFLLPFLLSIAGGLLVLVGLLIAFMKWAAKRDRIKFGPEGPSSRPENPGGGGLDEPSDCEEPSHSETSIRIGDLAILLVLFAVLPLAAVFLLALFTTAGQDLIAKNASDPSAWLDFWNSALGITNGLLQLFGII